MLNKQKGDMYGFVTHTWNVIKGKCPHNCEYCYMKRFPQKDIHFDETEFKTDLGSGNLIFIGSSNDMWADNISVVWIDKILEHIEKYPGNTYLFQSKNPKRFLEFGSRLMKTNIILGTTIETNRNNKFTGGQEAVARAESMCRLESSRKMVTIEPIMEFDLDELLALIKKANPEFLNIGADSKNHHLPEPSKEKILRLIKYLEKFTKVNLKPNIRRILYNNPEKLNIREKIERR
jgi:organic radical activating enzyme